MRRSLKADPQPPYPKTQTRLDSRVFFTYHGVYHPGRFGSWPRLWLYCFTEFYSLKQTLLKYAGLGAVLLLMLCGAQSAQAQSSRMYIAGYMGLNTMSAQDFSHPTSNGSIDFKNGGSFAGALGLRLTPNFRVEAEVSYARNDLASMTLDSGAARSIGKNMKTWLYMAHGYYDFNANWRNITPFISGGLGLAMHDVAIDGAPGGLGPASDTSYELAYSLGAGLKYQLKPGMALTGGYRYVGSSSLGIGDYNIDYNAHEFRAGLQYDLPVDLFR